MNSIENLTFQHFLEMHFTKRKQQILSATNSLIIDSGYNGMTLRKVADIAKIKQPIICYYFEKKVSLVKTLLIALLDYAKQIIFHPLQHSDISCKENMLSFIQILKRFKSCEEIKTIFLLPVETTLFHQQTQAYYCLWEQLISGFLFAKNKEKVDMPLVQHSIGLIHTPLMMKVCWNKACDIDYLLYNLGLLWRDLLGEVTNILFHNNQVISKQWEKR